jgi:hypothetical protein
MPVKPRKIPRFAWSPRFSAMRRGRPRRDPRSAGRTAGAVAGLFGFFFLGAVLGAFAVPLGVYSTITGFRDRVLWLGAIGHVVLLIATWFTFATFGQRPDPFLPGDPFVFGIAANALQFALGTVLLIRFERIRVRASDVVVGIGLAGASAVLAVASFSENIPGGRLATVAAGLFVGGAFGAYAGRLVAARDAVAALEAAGGATSRR